MSDDPQQEAQDKPVAERRMISHPYPVVDAGIMALLTQIPGRIIGGIQVHVVTRRLSVTTGSARYRLNLLISEGEQPFMRFGIRMIDLHQTLLITEYQGDHPEGPRFAQLFSEWVCESLDKDIEAAQHLASGNPTHPIPQPQFEKIAMVFATLGVGAQRPKSDPKPRGAPTNKLNDWARQEIARGRNQQVVFNEYYKRLQSDHDAEGLTEDKARDRFRKAIAPAKAAKSGRK